METLVDWLNARTFTAAAVLATAVFLGVKFQDGPRNRYHRWRYTSRTEKTSMAGTIEKELDAKASLRLRALHHEVSAEIASAVAEGFPVASLQETADGLLQLDTPALRSQAVDRLQKLRLSIPTKRPKLRVVDERDEEPADPSAIGAGRPRARKR